MKPRISMITLGVTELERSVRFYEQGLGLPRMESPPGVAFFTLNGSWLGLYSRESLADDAGVSPEGSGFSESRLHTMLSLNQRSTRSWSRPCQQAPRL